MAWITLYFLLVVFTAILMAFIAGVFFVHVEQWILGVFVGLDSVIGWSIKHVVSYLFPRNSASPPPVEPAKP
jgi:hypothetical protein